MNQLDSNSKIEDVIKAQGFYASTTVGVSMKPMLRNRRDTIVIKPKTERLKKYDVPLYKRGDDYVLHRVIKVLPDGYIIRGDNCIDKEYVTDDMLLGVLAEFYRNPKDISKVSDDSNKSEPVNMDGFGYKAYVRFWHYTYWIRKPLKKFKSFGGRVLRKMGIRK